MHASKRFWTRWRVGLISCKARAPIGKVAPWSYWSFRLSPQRITSTSLEAPPNRIAHIRCGACYRQGFGNHLFDVLIGPDIGVRITIVGWYYDKAVRGSDPVTARPGFADMLVAVAADSVRTIIVESPDRFARDLAVQLTGHDHLKRLGVTLIPASAADHFTEETPTAVLVRQVLGAIVQFDKASIVAKLKAARDRKRAATGKCGGRHSHMEARPEMVQLAKRLRRKRPKGGQRSLREISAALAAAGYVNERGSPTCCKPRPGIAAC